MNGENKWQKRNTSKQDILNEYGQEEVVNTSENELDI